MFTSFVNLSPRMQKWFVSGLKLMPGNECIYFSQFLTNCTLTKQFFASLSLSPSSFSTAALPHSSGTSSGRSEHRAAKHLRGDSQPPCQVVLPGEWCQEPAETRGEGESPFWPHSKPLYMGAWEWSEPFQPNSHTIITVGNVQKLRVYIYRYLPMVPENGLEWSQHWWPVAPA